MSEIDRRNFLKLIGVGAGATAAAGCSELPEKLIPYVIQPEEITPGVPVFYASTCQECSVGLRTARAHARRQADQARRESRSPGQPRLAVRARSGGDRSHLSTRVAYQSPMQRGSDGTHSPRSPGKRRPRLLANKLAAAGSKAQLLGGPKGPTLGGLIADFATAVGAGGNVHWEPFAHESLREATRHDLRCRPSAPAFHLANCRLHHRFRLGLPRRRAPRRATRVSSPSARDIVAHPDGGAHARERRAAPLAHDR